MRATDPQPSCSAKMRQGELACICCGGPLHAREGKYLLKYFLIERPF